MKESILKPVKEPIETKEYIDDFKVEEIKSKWKLILAQKDKTKSFEAFNRFSDFGAKLRKKYSDFKDYRLYHILGGSGGHVVNECTNFDFPGDDSVEKFIEDQYNNLDNN